MAVKSKVSPTFLQLAHGIRQRGGIAGGKVQAVNPLLHGSAHVAKITGKHGGAHRMGFRRDQGKAFIAQAGAKGGAALGQKLGKCSMRELAGKGYSIGGVLFGPGFQRAGTGHDQLRCVRPQQLPGLDGGAQPL